METEPRVIFQHLHKELVEYQLRFVDITLKGAGLMLLILGWMLTSREARTFIGTNAKGRAAAVTGLTMMVLAYVFIAIRMTRVMQTLSREMDALEYLPRAYYEFRVLPPRIIAAASAVIIAPAGITIAFMLFGTG